MSGIASSGEIQRKPATKNLGRRRAAGIYGAIVTAAILDTAGGHVSTAALAVSVVSTLLACGRQRGTSGSSHPADSPRLAGWPAGLPCCTAVGSSSLRPSRPP